MMDIPEKVHWVGPIRRVGLLVAFTFVAVLAVWSIDESTFTDLVRKYPSRDFQTLDTQHQHTSSNSNNLLILQIQPSSSSSFPSISPVPAPTTHPEKHNSNTSSEITETPHWVTVDLPQNYTANLLSKWTEPGGAACKDAKTVDIRIRGIDNNVGGGGGEESPRITLTTSESHEMVFQAVDGDGNPRCLGGDYFELDLSGENWKSRPPLTDFGNGTYSFILQVHQDFYGEYNLTISLLFRHFEGLKFSPNRFRFDKQVRVIPITFTLSKWSLPELQSCKGSDFNRMVWSGRWTRHARNDKCEISEDGRYRCQAVNYPCQGEWCRGRLGSLESNGWVYSAHCGFKLFSREESWKCLNRKWLFWWGDSNHVDTIRNLLFFVLGIEDLDFVTRRFDVKLTNPRNESEWVRITNVFNGHWNMTGNYEGLNSLSDEEYRGFIRGYFNESTVPDTVVFNSGLHDGVKWRSIKRYVGGAEYAASFWEEVMRGRRMLTRVVFRSTVSTGGYARTLAFNPSKMEVYNSVLLEKMKDKGLVDAVVDDFDMTWAWHFDNRCNDGVHYGRFPAKRKWRDGEIGHQYFVDLMLAHVLLNAICST